MADVAYKPAYSSSNKTIYAPPSKSTYMMNYYEWIKEQSTQILIRGSNLNGTASNTILTVPEGYTFYVSSLTLTLSDANASNNVALLTKGATFNTSMNDCLACVDCRAVVAQNIAQNFSFPIKINQKESIFLWQGGGGALDIARCSIQGFLTPNYL